jgi:hypothetical protein
MPARSSRDQSPPNNRARHLTFHPTWRRRRRRCRRDCVFWVWQTKSPETQRAPTPPMSAPYGLARRFWGNASGNAMPAWSARDQSPPHYMARYRTLWRAVASASAKMPRNSISFCISQSRDYSLILYVVGSAYTIQPHGWCDWRSNAHAVDRSLAMKIGATLSHRYASEGSSWNTPFFGRKSGTM